MHSKLLAPQGATFAQYQGVETIASYAAGARAEYEAALQHAALMDRSFLGRVELTGDDRLNFLQRISSNDMHALKPGDGLQTVLTTPEARIIDLLTVYVQPDSLLCITSPQNRHKVHDWLRRNIFFRDKVKPRDVSDSTAQFTLFGPRAADVLRARSAEDLSPLPSYHSTMLTIDGVGVRAARVPYIAGGGYDLICAADDAERIWQSLLDGDVLPMGTTAYDWLRIAAAQPLYGFELSEEINALEANLRHAISFAKGCYTGQEVIARLDTYQKLKQRLVVVQLSELPRAPLPLPLRIDENEVGTLTSAAPLPDRDGALGLGYVRTKFYQPNAQVQLHADGGPITGTLLPLPDRTAEVKA